MLSYLWYKKIFDNNFIESEHPRDGDGKFAKKETSANKNTEQYISRTPEQHKQDKEKIGEIASWCKELGVRKVKNVKATKYGSLYISALLPMKNQNNGKLLEGYAKISLRGHPSDKNFDLILDPDITKEQFRKHIEKLKAVFLKTNNISEVHSITRKDQYK